MKRYTWHSLPLLLVLLVICIGRCIAQEAAFHAEHVLGYPDDGSSAEATSEQKEHVLEHAQSREVEEALSILRDMRPAVASKLSRYTHKPKGVVGSTIYYAKEAFTLLFLTSPVKTTPILTTTSIPVPPKLPTPLAGAVSLLEDAVAESNDADALFLLAEMNFHGNFTHPLSYSKAFEYYKRLADATGNSTAQYMLGFMLATGLDPIAGQDQAKSLLYYTFAADQGDTRAEMTLAYNHHVGISVAQDCEQAVRLYQRVADKAIAFYRSGPPGGHSLIRDSYRIADELGGVYGEGASFSSSGMNARHGGPTSDAHAKVDDVLEYLLFQSSKGDLRATLSLATLYLDGARDLKRDLRLAKQYFMVIARKFWDSQGKLKKDAPQGYDKLGSKAAGYLGRMFLRGEGMEQSFSKARIWFERGIANGDALSQYHLGLMHMYALGVDESVEKAADYFSAAADQGLAVAQTNLGILFLDQGDVTTAYKYFDLAARNHHIEAFYYLAEMSNEGIGRQRSCSSAAAYYKIVTEKAEAIWASIDEANDAYEDGDYHKALIRYLMAAEMGSENAQANVAWILDATKPRWSLLRWFSPAVNHANMITNASRLALRYWTRSARQGNLDSMVKLGDCYLAGLGTSASSDELQPQPENAAACYQAAAETSQAAQAMWNLGWMHENGVGGVKQDFHLAKRYYDQALATNREAYLPVKLSLLKLRWRSWWNRVTYGSVKSIQEEEVPKKQRTFMEWLAEFLEADAQQYNDEYGEADDWDHSDRDTFAGEGDYWDADELYDDDLVITLIICGLIGVLFWLLYYRQHQARLLEQRRRQAVQAGDAPAEPQPDRGVFPAPGDPAWNQWVAGGIGH